MIPGDFVVEKLEMFGELKRGGGVLGRLCSSGVLAQLRLEAANARDFHVAVPVGPARGSRRVWCARVRKRALREGSTAAWKGMGNRKNETK